MFNDSRIDIYDYISDMLNGVVSDSVYKMYEPESLTSDAVKNGFIVIKVGELNNESEFGYSTYAWVRCYIEAYVPIKNNGELNEARYKEMEDGINMVINLADESGENGNGYSLDADNVISYDDGRVHTAGNMFHIFGKSFTVDIHKEND